ncbi:MAG: hypothetical protein M9941_17720 [Anaerolineae bacterium]|nr:hypothetical protein [Anaerolineae bacterium]MCO5199581.1 hypothetical protein [Anaerolineae bacterium]
MSKSTTLPVNDSAEPQLGRRLATYGSTRQGFTLNIIAGAALIIAGAAAAILSISAWDTTGILCATVGIVLIMLGTWGIYSTLRRKQLLVTVYRDGLTYRAGKQQTIIYWEEIASFFCDTPEHYAAQRFSNRNAGQPVHFCKIRTVDGQTFAFDDTLRHVYKLAAAIDENTVALIAPYVMTAFEAGSAIDFGPLVVSREGLQTHNAFCPWHEVVRFDISRQRGTIVVEQANNPVRFGTFMIAYVPNMTSLKVIVQRMLAEHTDGNVALRTLAA